jgi:class 3 adenylate cyclase/tetratricopeptide (TPR) repeat protein
MDIVVWLRSLGLGRYEAAFRDNEIDETVLPNLTAEDLKDLGVSVVGHRRKFLDAIAALRIGAHTKASSSDAVTTSSASPEDRAERRQVTVMFSDLVGSTALSARMDPEDMREIISAYQKCVAETVGRFGGFVAKYMGDGVLVYFGSPQAHEDDAERAVRAGLELVAAIRSLKTRVALQTRVGVATGLVVVGDLIGSGASQEQAIVGETPNLAARLQGIAEPNTVVIAESTRRLLGNLFEFEDLGLKNLKGIADPVYTWAVLRPSIVEGRFEALHASRLISLVGRDEEIELLLRRWSKAKTGEGQVVLLSGEAGIGKSRLTAALLERLATEPHARLRYFCSPQHTDSALYPVIGQMERAAGFVHDDTPQARLDKLDAFLAQTSTPARDAALFAEMLSLPNDGRYPSLDELTAEQRRQRTLEALSAQMRALSRQNPVLMILEDVHWTDPTSLEAFGRAVDRLRTLCVLLIVTFRPEFEPPWIGRPHVTTLTLNRLGEREIAALINGVTGNKPLPAKIRIDIVERTDGIPLFIEEMTKAVLEAESEGDARQTAAAVPASALAVPASLHASLMARLDRLGPAKEVAQSGAVIGREFSHVLLAAVMQKPDAELASALDRLIQSGLLFRQGVPPHATYLFKHALVQDAAYGTLLRGRRQELHARVAGVLERNFPELVERQPELLAHHLSGAGAIERAIDEWLKAGQHAAARSAHVEAIGHFDRGLAALAAFPESPARDRQEIELQLARGLSLFTVEGFQATEADRVYTRARELAERRGDPRQMFMATYGLWQSANGAAKILNCRSLSKQLEQLTADDADDELRLQAHHSAWATNLFAGEPAVSQEHCKAGRELYDPERHRLHHQLYGGHDPGTCALCFGAQAHWLLGYPDTGLALGSEALALGKRISHPFSFVLAMQYNSMVHLERGEPEVALQLLDAAEALASEQQVGFVVEPQLLRGAALMAQGAFEEAVVCLREGLANPKAMRVRCYGFAKLADVLARRGEYGTALAAARDGLSTAEDTGHRQWEAELRRFEGMALSGLNRPEEGQSALEGAMRIARRQQAKAYELRAATSLARLWGEQGRRAEAHKLLAPIYGWFTEGLDTSDLKVAKALLDALGP